MVQRNGCEMACNAGSECCVECREIALTQNLEGNELWDAVLLLHEGA